MEYQRIIIADGISKDYYNGWNMIVLLKRMKYIRIIITVKTDGI
jgi:hypothetical protein